MNLKIIFLTILGFIFFIFAAIGLFLPLWPTTPFVLLSFACFSSYPRLRKTIMRIGFFRDHIENYQNKKGLPIKTFVKSMIWLWGMIIISMYFMQILWISFLLIFIGAAVTFHIAYMLKDRS